MTVITQGRTRRISVYGTTITDLKRAEEEKRRQLGSGWVPGNGDMRVKELAHRWLSVLLDEARRGAKSIRTYEQHEWLLRKHILPELGDLGVQRFTDERYERVEARIRGCGLSEQTCAHVFATLHRMFQFAVEKHWLAVHPMSGLRKPTARQYKAYVLSRGEVQRFLAAATDEPNLGTALITLVALGLRVGEALGLRQSAVNARGQLEIRAQLQRLPRALRPSAADDGFVIVERAKWGSEGSLALPALARSSLQAQVRRQAERQLVAGPNWPETIRVMRDGRLGSYVEERNDLYFTTVDGRPLDPHAVRRALIRVCQRAKIPWSGRGRRGLRVHDLRVAASTLLSEQGASAREVMAYMRHRSPQMFLHYTKVEEQTRARTAGLMDRILGAS
jgi:integrase